MSDRKKPNESLTVAPSMPYTVVVAKLSDIEPAPWNPKSRITKLALRPLLESIREDGLINEPIVYINYDRNQRRYSTVDGHRRIECVKMLGHGLVRVKVFKNKDVASLYAILNGTGQRIRGDQALIIWLTNKAAIHGYQAKRMEEMAQDLGIELLRNMANGGFSYWLYNVAVRIRNYCGRQKGDFTKKATRYLMKHGTRGIREAMQNDVNPGLIARAVLTDKPIHMRPYLPSDKEAA